MSNQQTLQLAKQELRQALTEHEGDVRQPVVARAIEALAQLNPTPVPARKQALQTGHWRLINAPSFPGGDRQANGQYHYTLGRLAFNMFQPTTLTVAIDRVFQPIEPLPDEQRADTQSKGERQTHDIWTEFTVVEEGFPALRGMVQNLGICQPYDDDYLQVEFTGGRLKPLPETDLVRWNLIFGNSAEHQSGIPVVQPSLKERLSSAFLKLVFGLVPPEGINANTGEVVFAMKRSPKGKLQILYLDEEMRITKGEKGTILVCVRTSA